MDFAALRAPLHAEITRVVANATNNFFQTKAADCVQRLLQSISISLGDEATVATCGSIQAIAKAELSLSCLQATSNTDEASAELANDIARGVTQSSDEELSTIALLRATRDFAMPSFEAVAAAVDNVIRANATGTCNAQNFTQALIVEVDPGTSIVSGCSVDEVNEYSAACMQENERIRAAIERGDTAEQIDAGGDPNVKSKCNELAACCDPETQGIDFRSFLNGADECVQLDSVTDAVLNLFEEAINRTQDEDTLLKTPNNDNYVVPTSTIVAIGSVIILVVVGFFTVIVATVVAKNVQRTPDSVNFRIKNPNISAV